MKSKVLWAFSMVLFLLVSCTFLSLRIEELMTPQVIKTASDFNDPGIDIDALFVDETGQHLFRIAEGAGWEQGVRAYEMEPDDYHITDGKIYPSQGGTYVVHYASKQPKDEEVIHILDRRGEQDDFWMVSSPIELPPLTVLLDNYTVLEQTENALFLSAVESPSPFMQGRARSTLFGPEVAFVDPNAAQYAVYSINDVKTFLRQLPLLAVLAVIFLFSMLLWLSSFPYLKRPKKYRKVLLLNGGLAAVMLLAMPFLLRAVHLPSSLLPQEYIFDLGYYFKEFEEIFAAFEPFTAQGGETAEAIFQCAGSARTASAAVLLGGFLLAAALVAAEAVLLKGRARGGRHFQQEKREL